MPENTTPGSTPETTPEVKVEDLPTEIQSYIKTLRHEAADRRVAAKDARSQAEAMAVELAEFRKAKETAAAEQGQFKNLYEAAKVKADEVDQYKVKLDSYDKYFGERLDETLQGVDPEVAELIKSSPKPITEKIEMARKFKAPEAGSAPAGDSPASTRPGAGGKPDADLSKRLEEARTVEEKAQLLTVAKAKFPKVYEAFMKRTY